MESTEIKWKITNAKIDDRKNLNIFFIFPPVKKINSRIKKKIIPEKIIREIVELFKNSLQMMQNSIDNQNFGYELHLI